ncbi:CoA transferase [Seohaeicola zhoushanensis]
MLREVLEERLGQFPAAEIAERLITSGVPCAPVRTVDQVITDPHTRASGMIVDIGEDYRGTASPIKLGRTPATYRKAPPSLGEDADAVAREFGLPGLAPASE